MTRSPDLGTPAGDGGCTSRAGPVGGEIITSVSSLVTGAEAEGGCGTTATTTWSDVTGARPSICWITLSSCCPGVSDGS